MKNCEICNRYGMTTTATTEAMIENEYNNNKSLQPVCSECAAQCNGVEAKQACEICDCDCENNKEICADCELTRPQDCVICGEISHDGENCASCAAAIDSQEDPNLEACLYCDCLGTPLDGKQAATIGWDIVAAEHAKNCEWVLTQAHTLN